MSEAPAGYLYRELYSFADADRLAGVPPGSARRWLRGYTRTRDGERVWHPPMTGQPNGLTGVSFAELVELVAIGRFRSHGFSAQNVRTVVEACTRVFGVAYPLSNLKFKVGGRDVFVDAEGALIDVLRGRRRMAWDEVLGPFLDTLDYEESLAVRWWPLGRGTGVALDPRFGFGLPSVVASGVRTEIVREQFELGEAIAQIADDFGLTDEDVSAALRFELQRAA